MRERIGDSIGRLLTPIVTALTRRHDAPILHAGGVTFVGHSEAIIGSPYTNLGVQLEGRVLARCSTALGGGRERAIDLLGIALRFRPGNGPPLDEHPVVADQDLTFTTNRSPLTMLSAMFTTDTHDFLHNNYWGVAPFAVHDHGRMKLRLRPIEPIQLQGSRDDRLRQAVASHRATWWLEARKTLTRAWHAVARITFETAVELDQQALHFDPFRTGCGVMPVGAVHAIRHVVYAASREARAAHHVIPPKSI